MSWLFQITDCQEPMEIMETYLMSALSKLQITGIGIHTAWFHTIAVAH